MDKKVLAVFGTRMETIQLAPVVALSRRSEIAITSVLLRGNHFKEPVDDVCEAFSFRPDIILSDSDDAAFLIPWKRGQFSELGEVLDGQRPDAVLVQGTSGAAFPAVLLSVLRQIPVGLVGARDSPLQAHEGTTDAAQRHLIQCSAHWMFASCADTRRQLCVSGMQENRIFVTGSPGNDAAMLACDKFESAAVQGQLTALLGEAAAHKVMLGQHALVAIELCRFSEERLRSLCEVLARISAVRGGLHFLFLTDQGTKLESMLAAVAPHQHCFGVITGHHFALECYLLSRCRFAVTNSNRLQIGAAAFGKPIIALKLEQEQWGTTWNRPEGCIVANTLSRLQIAIFQTLAAPQHVDECEASLSDGFATERILRRLKKDLGGCSATEAKKTYRSVLRTALSS